MTEPITPIDPAADLRGQIVDVVRSALRPETRQPEAAAPGQINAEPLPGVGRKVDEERMPEAEPKAEPAVDVSRNLALRFRIDPDTHNVTVLLVDQATKKIVRSVPPEDLQKLNSGDLVQLLA